MQINKFQDIVLLMKLKPLTERASMLDSLLFLCLFLKLTLVLIPLLYPDFVPIPFDVQYFLLSKGNCFHLSIASSDEYPWAFLKAILPLILFLSLGSLKPDLDVFLSPAIFFFHNNLIIVEI